MTHELFAILCRSALAAAIALMIVLVARVPARRWLGAHAAYRLWLLVPVAAVAILLPAPVRPLAVALQVAPSLQTPVNTIDLNATIASTPFDVQPWLLAAWMIGACTLLFWFVLQQRRYLRNLGTLVDTDAGVLRAQTSVGSPALVGALRPRIVLPSDFESRYTQRERELVLAHEHTHLRRGDAQINALVALLRCLNWFNPLFHLAASRFRFDQELACDALVVARFPEARRCYADAMLKAQLAGQARQELRLPAGCYWPSSHPLKERIAMLKFPVLSPRRQAIASAAIVALTLGVGYASWAAQPNQAPVPRPASSVAPASDIRVRADLRLSVDGSKLDGSWNSETHNTGFMHHEGDSDSWTLIPASGQQFSFAVTRNSERWELTGVASDREDGTIEFKSTLKHNGAIVSQPSLVVVNGETAAIQIGDDLSATGGGFKGFKLDIRLTKTDALQTSMAAAQSSAAPVTSDYTQPSENITFRRMMPPKYPPQAVKAHVQGEVTLKVHIDAEGVPISAEVADIEPPTALELGSAAVATAMSWRYNPATRNGAPVDGYLSVPITFSLSNKSGMPEPAADSSRALPVTYRKMSPPTYPEHAIASKLSGTVYTRLEIAADGSVRSGRVEQVVPPSAVELGDAALAAVKTWTFNPQTVNGMAIPGEVRVPVQFKLNGYTPTKAAQAATTLPPVHTLEMVTITGPAR